MNFSFLLGAISGGVCNILVSRIR